jgi:hypothetical protein
MAHWGLPLTPVRANGLFRVQVLKHDAGLIVYSRVPG